MANIAFIGLGNMGGPMAINLAKAGHQVCVFDLSADAVAHVVAAGASTKASAIACVQGAQFVISMLPAGKHVDAVYLAENTGLINHIEAGCLVIDSSTIDAATSCKVAKALATKDINFVDAPVSGGVGGAVAGTLSFMVGGSTEEFAQAEPILMAMGKNIFHAGVHGAGQIAKVCNNMLLSVLMVGTSEALQLGLANGLDPKVLSNIMSKSSGSNWTLDGYNPCPGVMDNVPASNDYQGGFMVDLMAKDLGLAMETSLASQSSTPMGALARSLYAMHAASGNGSKDFSSIFKLFNKK
ncbi:3-hydroxyisobutyrate dehydrogenase [Colwellia sp. MT41]|uniref:3-hydroxyisobutyrate dehydrogenase n=1 Tax=Colwellia marinimaniae TaxID=1513592 RepID=A0ABQ0MZC2_9GAMM|nr:MULTISPECIES: 3-hydroxyisobutyrate dehydrogenase [Colwellia]ALO34370.1 3-hydroxyisobutyrate dehydrogenase [Colwellia sp. MT41]GAW97716.1 3-hydroxyisobutyrate dehydrogenase [Colwellia marinimaniae]